jgi:hypothetical protein
MRPALKRDPGDSCLPSLLGYDRIVDLIYFSIALKKKTVM